MGEDFEGLLFYDSQPGLEMVDKDLLGVSRLVNKDLFNFWFTKTYYIIQFWSTRTSVS